MSDIDIVERDAKVILIDEEGESHEFMRTDEGYVFIPDGTSLAHVDALQASDVKLVDDQQEMVSWPLEISTSHHLEDVVGRQIGRHISHETPLEHEYFVEAMGGRADLPAIEILENWEVDQNGRCELVSVEYNGTTYTPE